MPNLAVDPFIDGFAHHSGYEMLQGGPQYACKDDDGENPHQHAGQDTSGLKAGMEKDQRIAEKSKPEMATHPPMRGRAIPDR